jgi:hypothetical protein
VRIECVDRDGRLIAATGDEVLFGEVVDVPDEIAGRAPAGDDPGEGLLAQVDVWRAAKAAKRSEKPADDEGTAPAGEE